MFTVGNEVRAFNTISLPLQRFSSASRFECVSNCLNINQNCTWTHSASINMKKKPRLTAEPVSVLPAWHCESRHLLDAVNHRQLVYLPHVVKRPCWLNGGGKRQHVSSPSHSTLGHPAIRHEHTCCWNSAVSHTRHSHTDTHKHKGRMMDHFGPSGAVGLQAQRWRVTGLHHCPQSCCYAVRSKPQTAFHSPSPAGFYTFYARQWDLVLSLFLLRVANSSSHWL